MIAFSLIILLASLEITKPSSLPSSNFQVILYEKATDDREGSFEILKLDQSSFNCTPIPQSWSNKSIDAVGLEKFCIRFWEDEKCSSPATPAASTGQKSRCYCDSRYISLEDSAKFLISKDIPVLSSAKAIGPCILNGEENETSIAWLFSENKFKGNLTTLVVRPQECLSFAPGDKWDGTGKSSWLWRGCTQFYDGEECSGNSIILSKEKVSVKYISVGKGVRSVRNCWGDEGVEGEADGNEKGENHGVGVLIYPKGFQNGLPWNKDE